MLRHMEPRAWYMECMDSLRPAIESGIICLHQIQGYPGQVGRGRALGFMQGEAPYVSHVDPDDIYNPDIFAAEADYLDEHPIADMVYSDEYILYGDGSTKLRRTPMDITQVLKSPGYAHGVRVYRRGAIMPHLDTLRAAPRYAEWALVRAMVQAGSRIAHTPVWGRQWRMHGGQTHRVEQRRRPAPGEDLPE